MKFIHKIKIFGKKLAPERKDLIKVKRKIWTLIFILVAILIYTFFKGLIISWVNETFFHQPFIKTISWNKFYDILIILVWVLLVVQNIIRNDSFKLKAIDIVIITFLLYNAFTNDWAYISSSISPSFKYVHLVLLYYVISIFKFVFAKVLNRQVLSSGIFDIDAPIITDSEDLIRRKRISSHIYISEHPIYYTSKSTCYRTVWILG